MVSHVERWPMMTTAPQVRITCGASAGQLLDVFSRAFATAGFKTKLDDGTLEARRYNWPMLVLAPVGDGPNGTTEVRVRPIDGGVVVWVPFAHREWAVARRGARAINTALAELERAGHPAEAGPWEKGNFSSLEPRL